MKKKKGFTLVELIIVIAVIGVLAAILIPTFANVIDKANHKSAMSDAKNALTTYNTAMLGDGNTIGTPVGTAIRVKKMAKQYYFALTGDGLEENPVLEQVLSGPSTDYTEIATANNGVFKTEVEAQIGTGTDKLFPNATLNIVNELSKNVIVYIPSHGIVYTTEESQAIEGAMAEAMTLGASLLDNPTTPEELADNALIELPVVNGVEVKKGTDFITYDPSVNLYVIMTYVDENDIQFVTCYTEQQVKSWLKLMTTDQTIAGITCRGSMAYVNENPNESVQDAIQNVSNSFKTELQTLDKDTIMLVPQI